MGPAHDEHTNNNNIQSIVTALLQLCGTYKMYENDDEEKQHDDAHKHESVDLMHLLLQKHGSVLTKLLKRILTENEPELSPSEVLVPSNATPELFIWHKIFLKMIDSELISSDLQKLCLSVTPPKNIDYRPWICIVLPTIDFKMNEKNQMINIGSDNFTKQPKSAFLTEYILKPIRVFLLSLTLAQSLSVPLSIFIDDIFVAPLINLNVQQITLLHEARSRIKESIQPNDLHNILSQIVNEYETDFCGN